MSWYDYPKIFDILYNKDTEVEVNFIEELKRAYCTSTGARILELACGSGRLLKEFYRRGYYTFGLDNNPNMVRYAKSARYNNGDRYNIFLQDMISFNQCFNVDVAFCLFGSFRYILNYNDVMSHLNSIGNALNKGGIYIIGFHVCDYKYPECCDERLKGEKGNIKVKCDIVCWPPNYRTRRQKFKSTMKVLRNNKSWEHETVWLFRTYGPMQAKKILNANKQLKLIAMHDYDYNINKTTKLYDERLDRIFVLKKSNTA